MPDFARSHICYFVWWCHCSFGWCTPSTLQALHILSHRVQFISFNHLVRFFQKAFCAFSRSCLSQVDVDNSQYYPAIKQMESYPACRQQNSLPQIHLNIHNINIDIKSLQVAMAEIKTTEKVKKSWLTDKWWHRLKFTLLCVVFTTFWTHFCCCHFFKCCQSHTSFIWDPVLTTPPSALVNRPFSFA